MSSVPVRTIAKNKSDELRISIDAYRGQSS